MKLFRHILLLTLTLLVLVSSTGLSVAMHLCGGELRDINLFGGTNDCPMEQQHQETPPPCHETPASDADCCEDHTLVVERLQDATDTKAQLLAKQFDIKFIAAIKVVVLQLYEQHVQQKPKYALYASPPITRDIPVLVQSFLI